MRTVTRYAYVDTQSQAGRPTKVEIPVNEITELRRWFNSYGNPSCVIHTHNSRTNVSHTYLCVDDYGATNGLGSIPISVKNHRKDMF